MCLLHMRNVRVPVHIKVKRHCSSLSSETLLFACIQYECVHVWKERVLKDYRASYIISTTHNRHIILLLCPILRSMSAANLSSWLHTTLWCANKTVDIQLNHWTMRRILLPSLWWRQRWIRCVYFIWGMYEDLYTSRYWGTVAIMPVDYRVIPSPLLGLRRLCQHNFWNNRKSVESGIMRE